MINKIDKPTANLTERRRKRLKLIKLDVQKEISQNIPMIS
jgi:hypothetical protein